MSEFQKSLDYIEHRKQTHLHGWTVAGGEYKAPRAEYFNFLIRPMGKANTYRLSLVTTRYALEVADKIPSPEKYCLPLDRIRPELPYEKRAALLDRFLGFLAFIETVEQQIEEAAEYSAEAAETDLQNIRAMIPECNFTNVPTLRVLNSIHKSHEPGFNQVNDTVHRLSRATIWVMYARQHDVDLIEPDWMNAAD